MHPNVARQLQQARRLGVGPPVAKRVMALNQSLHLARCARRRDRRRRGQFPSEPVARSNVDKRLPRRRHSHVVQRAHERRALQGVEHGRARACGRSLRAVCKLGRPRDEGAPDEKADGDDDGDHDEQAAENGRFVGTLGREREVRAEAREVAVVELEALDLNEEEPAGGGGDDRVSNEADGAGRQLKHPVARQEMRA